VHRVSLRAIAYPNEVANDLNDNFVPPRVGRSMAPQVRQQKFAKVHKQMPEESFNKTNMISGAHRPSHSTH